MLRTILMAVLLLLFSAKAECAEPGYLYKAKFVQAAPGRLLELIDLHKSRLVDDKAYGDQPPLVIRHTQGDKWDLMMLFPIGNYETYYSSERIAGRRQSEERYSAKLRKLIAWQEDLYVYGPPLDEFRKQAAKAGFFHLEIFISLPGKHAELYREREMENAYQRALKRPATYIFVRDQGAAWDTFTLGLYRDLKHYAESADISEKDQEAAARSAGFESARHIGPYLRSLIQQHHDTLAVPVK